jgi:PIN like domain
MRDLFPGYYRPTTEQFKQFWEDGIIALDTNVLLSLYRFSDPARSQLFAILDKVQERLWIPHQVALEFQRGRIGVIDEQRQQYDRVIEEIAKSKKAILSRVRRRSAMDHTQLSKKLEEQLKPVVDELEELKAGHTDPLTDEDWIGTDTVRDQLDQLLQGRIGAGTGGTEALKEGPRRYATKTPPGYKDEKKPESDRYGDLILWFELLAHAKEKNQPLVLITGEQKDDWWLSVDGQIVSPRPELVAEMADAAGVAFYMYGLESFMSEASQRFGIETSKAALREAKDITERTSRNWQILTTPLTDLGNAFATTGTWMTTANPQFTYTFPAQVSAFVLNDEVVLTFRPGSSYPQGGKVTCVVTDHQGDTFQSIGGAAAEGAVAIRFPTDFAPEVALAPGTYGTEWYDVPEEPGKQANLLAVGEFDVESAPT